jgi:hypothetical protein
MSPDDTVNAKYVGDYEVWSPGHDCNIRPGDIVPMPEAEARARADFEVVTEEKKSKGGDK